jgi:hypothetical protein
MAFQDWLTTGEISAIFADEMTAAGGRVTETFDDGARLFVRSILAGEREVQRGDRVQGGVALRATAQDISVHPYVFRQVCTNGAIFAQARQSRRIERTGFSSDLDFELREAVQSCSAEDAFTVAAGSMRSAVESEIDVALMMMPMLSRLSSHAPAEVLAKLLVRITQRFGGDRDQSRFAFMNAVTSVARDTPDPDLRWRLEEFGGLVSTGIETREHRLPPVFAGEKTLARVS